MINDVLENYKKITEEIISNIKNDVDVNNLMDKREELINKLFEDEKININNIKEIYLSKGLVDLDKKLEVAIKEEQLKVKEEIRDLHKRKNANNAYEKNRQINNFFNTKI